MKTKSPIKVNILILTIVIFIGIPLIFVSLYIFTRPASSEIWDFSNTGSIGDTIGGITAPIIGLIGTVLLIYTFREQYIANKRQDDLLKNIELQKIFERHLMLLDDLEKKLKDIEFTIEISPTPISYRGISALDQYVKRLKCIMEPDQIDEEEKYDSKNLELNFQFILVSLNFLLNSINRNIIDAKDLEFILIKAKFFYLGFLEEFASVILEYDDYMNESPDCELKNLKNSIDQKFMSFSIITN